MLHGEATSRAPMAAVPFMQYKRTSDSRQRLTRAEAASHVRH